MYYIRMSAWFSFFTFHYVSINTYRQMWYNFDVYNFTFHYVSINTKFGVMMMYEKIPLHSIMFLLILRKQKKILY